MIHGRAGMARRSTERLPATEREIGMNRAKLFRLAVLVGTGGVLLQGCNFSDLLVRAAGAGGIVSGFLVLFGGA